MPEQEPEGWMFARLTEHARLESGHTPSRKRPDYWSDGVPWVSLHDTKLLDQPEIHHTTQTISELGLQNSSARLLPRGTVVFSRTATVGKATVLGREMATSQDFANYTCGPLVFNRFLMQLLRFLQPEWRRLMAGSTHNTIYMPVFENLQVLLPPLPEQWKIAAILSSVDDAIEKTQAVIDQLAVVKRAMMAELLTRGLPGRHRHFKQTEIGKIPVGWQVATGESLFTLFGGYGPSSIRFADDGDTLFAKVADINEPDNFIEIQTTALRFNAEDNPGIRSYGAGHLLFPKRGAAIFKNRVRLLIRPTSVDPNLMVLRPFETIHAPFLMYYLLHFGLFNLSDNSGVPQLNNKHLYPHVFPYPPMAEQQEIAEAMTLVEQRYLTEAGKLDGLQQTKAALMNVLLTGELRVTPDEEPT
jgi:type I restriction enzyme S subunit